MKTELPDSLEPYRKGLLTAEVSSEPLADNELARAMTLQSRWLLLDTVRHTIKVMGWDFPIHRYSSVTYKDVRDKPRYNWHKWMNERLERETA